MIPGKIKIISVLTILLSFLLMAIWGRVILIFLGLPILGFLSIIAFIGFLGAIMLLISGILLLMGKKAGYYLYLIGWIINSPSVNSVPGFILFAFVIISFSMLRNDDAVRTHLQLSDNWMEKSLKKPA
jgi:hypothetical protein